jgi:molybdopterin molybdotransferase
LRIVGFIGAGATFEGEVGPGQCVRIMTGAPIPAGADTVVKIEDVEVLGLSATNAAGTDLVLRKLPRPGDNIRMHGEDAHKGDILLRPGIRINAAAAGLLASTGHASVLVARRPRVAIISTGSELVEPTTLPGPGQIRNSNSYSLSAQVVEVGGIPHILPMVEDSEEALRASLGAAVAEHDFVITSGGAAEGDFDYLTKVVGEMGTLFYNKVNMKPGKAQTFGLIEGVPVFGLPGNPVAAAVGFEILIRPALRKMQGLVHLKRPLTPARISTDINKKNESRRLYLRSRLECDDEGGYRVTPEANQSSALLSVLNRSNCLLVVPEGSAPVAAGTLCTCLRLDIDEGVV